MPGVLNLGDVFQFIVDCLDNGSLPQQDSVVHRPQAAFHIVFQFGNQLYPVNEELVEQAFADIPLVSDKFPVDKLNKGFDFQRLAVIDIPRGDHEVQNLPLVIAYQVQFEAVEPAQRAFTTLC